MANATALREFTSSDRLLLIGYGWRDEHVNAWINEHLRTRCNSRIGVVTKRTGKDVCDSTPQETMLRRLALNDRRLGAIYERVSGEAEALAEHGRLGRIYLVTTGVPMKIETENALLSYLFE